MTPDPHSASSSAAGGLAPAGQDSAVERRVGQELAALITSEPRPTGSARRRVRINPLGPGSAHGVEELSCISDDFGALVTKADAALPRHEVFVGEDYLKIHFRLCGDSEIAFPGKAPVAMRGPVCGIMLHPKDLVKHERTLGGRESWVTLYCRPGLITDTFELSARVLPQQFRKFLDGQTPEIYQSAVPLSTDMAYAVNSLLRTPMAGPIKDIFVQSKLLDLMCQSLNALADQPDRAGTAGLSARDAAKLDDARDILDGRYCDPPTLHQLGRAVGLNQNKLAAGFRERFGVTVYNYCVAKRMAHALDLLRRGDLSISDIAYELGYDYPGNFSAAFKRHFGSPPRVVRH